MAFGSSPSHPASDLLVSPAMVEIQTHLPPLTRNPSCQPIATLLAQRPLFFVFHDGMHEAPSDERNRTFAAAWA